MAERKKTEAQIRAQKKYMENFVEIKVRMTADKRSIVQNHAAKMGESATGFINRAIDETMAKDKLQFLPELSDKDEEARKIAGTSVESMKLTKLILEHGTPNQIERARKDSLSVKDIAIEILSNMTVTE